MLAVIFTITLNPIRKLRPREMTCLRPWVWVLNQTKSLGSYKDSEEIETIPFPTFVPKKFILRPICVIELAMRRHKTLGGCSCSNTELNRPFSRPCTWDVSVLLSRSVVSDSL